MEMNILEIKDLHTTFRTTEGVARAVNGVDLVIPKGSIAGLVGESGCGKSMTARSVMGLVRYPGMIESGSILLDGRELTGLKEKELRDLCGREMSMIFQEPMTSLNPVIKVGKQVAETLLTHGQASSVKEAEELVLDMFRQTGIPEPEARYNCYPHELSGGLRQRVMIAMAMICMPKLLIADEPTTALDVTVEAQILSLMRELRSKHGTSILMITHNLGVVAELCDHIYVMYAGRILEHAPVMELFDRPMHPYTRGLMDSIPRLDREMEYLHTIPGFVPELTSLPQGCPFADRCGECTEKCTEKLPDMIHAGDDHYVRCIKAGEGETS